MTEGLAVVVLTSGEIGIEVAARLASVPEVRAITVVTTREIPGRRSLGAKLRGIVRYDGVPGLVRAARRRLARATGGGLGDRVRSVCPRAAHVHLPDLHAPSAIERLRALGADLGVVVAAYKLRPEVFSVPRLGCLNLHLGKAPEFRGSSPGFYEMLEGVHEVGVTVHRVTESLDGGAILAQECFPLDPAPPGDPLAYLRRLQRQTLVPNGARMMAEVVAALAHGAVAERMQDLSAGRPRRRATWALKRELRRVVRARQRDPVPLTARPAVP